MGRPKLPPEEARVRFDAHLHSRDRMILDWLIEQEGGSRSQVVSRALALYCTRIETLKRAGVFGQDLRSDIPG